MGFSRSREQLVIDTQMIESGLSDQILSSAIPLIRQVTTRAGREAHELRKDYYSRGDYQAKRLKRTLGMTG